MSDWQPIETAPIDGTLFDAYGTRNGQARRFTNAQWVERLAPGTGNGTGEFHWTFDGKDMYGEFELTHWMPRPNPPNHHPQGEER